MPSAGITEHTARLDATFDRAANFDNDPEIQAGYTRYLCILVAGFIERSVEDILQSYAEQKADSRVSRYVSTTLRRRGNLRATQIVSLFGDFDESWKELLDDSLTAEQRQAIGNVYANRNPIVHGEDVDLTYTQIRDDYHRVKDAVNALQAVAL